MVKIIKSLLTHTQMWGF